VTSWQSRERWAIQNGRQPAETVERAFIFELYLEPPPWGWEAQGVINGRRHQRVLKLDNVYLKPACYFITKHNLPVNRFTFTNGNCFIFLYLTHSLWVSVLFKIGAWNYDGFFFHQIRLSEKSGYGKKWNQRNQRFYLNVLRYLGALPIVFGQFLGYWAFDETGGYHLKRDIAAYLWSHPEG